MEKDVGTLGALGTGENVVFVRGEWGG